MPSEDNLTSVDDCPSFHIVPLNSQEAANWSIIHMHSGIRRSIFEACLVISSIALTISFLVYAILPKLRTVPGKCLMGLIASELVTNLLVMLAMRSNSQDTFCSMIGVCLHYCCLTILFWTNIIAFDIVKKLRYPNTKLRHFTRYIFLAYLGPLILITVSLSLDRWVPFESDLHFLRPNYGKRYCGMNNYLAKLVFLILPASISLAINFFIFLVAIFKIRKVTREISLSSIPSSLRKRVFWYLKLAILLGVSSFFSFVGNAFISRCKTLNFVLLILNFSHGIFIFMAFTCKRSIFKLLLKLLQTNKSYTPSSVKMNDSLRQVHRNSQLHYQRKFYPSNMSNQTILLNETTIGQNSLSRLNSCASRKLDSIVVTTTG